MGTTNLKAALENSYAGWLGQLTEDERRAVQIVTMYEEELPVLTKRAADMKRLLESADTILSYIAPGWTPTVVKPRRPHAHQGLADFGDVAKLTLDILRESTVSLTIREIASRIIEITCNERRAAFVRRISFAEENGSSDERLAKLRTQVAELDVEASPEDRKKALQRVTNAVDSTLRQKRGKLVDCEGVNPRKWFIRREPRLAA